MRIHPLHTDIPKPERFTYPFCYEPHPLCQLAAKEVQEYIARHGVIREDADNGKMFGVLIVESPGVSPSQQGKSEGVFFPASPIAVCWLVATTGTISSRLSLTHNSPTAISRPRNVRYLSPLTPHLSPLNKCPKTSNCGSSISISC